MYFLVELCWELADCNGLGDFDDATDDAKNGKPQITSSMDIKFEVFQFLSAEDMSKGEAYALLDEGKADAEADAAQEHARRLMRDPEAVAEKIKESVKHAEPWSEQYKQAQVALSLLELAGKAKKRSHTAAAASEAPKVAEGYQA